MEETIGKAQLRGAAIGTGIAVDKTLALTGQTAVAMQVVLPTPEQEAEHRARHDRLNTLTAKLDLFDNEISLVSRACERPCFAFSCPRGSTRPASA